MIKKECVTDMMTIEKDKMKTLFCLVDSNY